MKGLGFNTKTSVLQTERSAASEIDNTLVINGLTEKLLCDGSS